MFLLRSACFLMIIQSLSATGVVVMFEPTSPETGPFPSDALAVPDAAQKTRRRVNLPMPRDCAVRSSHCLDVATVNQFDGFSILPRLRVRFSGVVDADTLRAGVFLVSLDNLTDEEYGVHRAATPIPINQVLYDPQTHTGYAKPDNILDQHRRYALVVTDAVREATGDRVRASPEFMRCIRAPAPDPYCGEVAYYARSLDGIAERFGAARRIVALSVFTTMSATAWMEKARDALNNTSPMLRFPEALFQLGDITSVTLRQQTRADQYLPDVPGPVGLVDGVSRLVFGSYWSPRFFDGVQPIPATPTAEPVPAPPAQEQIRFHLWVPSSARPQTGYPVVIALGGITTHSFDTVPLASVFAREGYAVIQLHAFGHPRGPQSHLQITERDGTGSVVPAGGRAVDVNRDGLFDVIEGFYDARNSTGTRDGQRQTVLDLIQLTRAIRIGMDSERQRSAPTRRHLLAAPRASRP
jgi:hypothetical protein